MAEGMRHRIQRAIRSVRFDLGLEMGLYPPKKSGDLILLYHNILPHSVPGFNVRNLGQREFEEELLYLKKRYTLVSLRELYEEPANDRKRIAITFDDGLINNLRIVDPILSRNKIPATLFICTSYLKGRNILWPDHLSMTGFKTAKDLTYKGETFRHLKGNRYVSDNGVRLTQRLMGEPIDEIQQFLDEVEKQTGFRPSDDYTHEERWRVMRAEEVRILAENPHIEIGSHGISHCNYKLLSAQDAMEDLQESKQYLESAIGKEVKSFAFPFGLYTRQSLDLATRVGYTRLLAVRFQHDDDHTDPRLRERTGIYNDRSRVEQMHLVNHAFHST
jgi:peptidoglycan/xylan/chitin deacetylase (PgdA/CDA1 family)